MVPDPIRFLSDVPPAIIPPLLLLFFSLITRLVVHEEPFLDFLHAIPPRLALAAAGIAVTAVLSSTSYVTLTPRADRGLIAVVVLIVFLACYLLTERMSASAKQGGSKQFWTVLGGGMAFGATMLAAHYAQPVR
ncbi:MAG: hypothetical protein M3361_17830 [Candidatus Tectomicrobia bacterium]|nr:hypothetical protein [Candidatus Tectomicrobia bacterium]